MLQANAGLTTRFLVLDDGVEFATITTKKPISLDELKDILKRGTNGRRKR